MLKIFNILDRKELLFVYLIFFLVFALSFLKIHGSSVGIFNNIFYGTNFPDKNLLFGKPRPIRSDEWLLTTPLTVSQSRNGFYHFNKYLGLGQEMSVIFDIPSSHWSTFFKPFNWSFFIMPLENAFAFKWWFRGASLIISTYLLLLYLTKNNYFLSVTGSLLTFFTPFVQWWYSSTTPVIDTTTYTFFIVYFFIKIFHFRKLIDLIFNTFFFTYFTICFILIFYPPFQITTGFVVIFFLTGYALNNRQIINNQRVKCYLTAMLFSLVITTVTILAYYLSFKDTLQIIQNTVYPGKREVVAGGYSLIGFFSGFFNILLQQSTRVVPQILINQSEASSFLLLSPFIIPVMIYYLVKKLLSGKNVDYVVLFISVYFLVSLTRLFVHLPLIDSLSKLLLVNLVPHNRLMIGVGVANLFLLVYFLNNVKVTHSINYKKIALIISLVAFFIHFGLGIYLKLNYPSFLKNNLLIFSISAFVFLTTLLLLLQKQRLFMLSLLLYAILSTMRINPIYRGLNPLINSPLEKEFLRVEKDNLPKGRWVIYDNLILGNYLASQRINSLTGIHLYPQFNLWQKFDPDKKYYSFYNRYAYVTFGDNVLDKIEFTTDHPLIFNVKINPCHPLMNELQVYYFIFDKEVNRQCLSLIKEIKSLSVPIYIYKKVI